METYRVIALSTAHIEHSDVATLSAAVDESNMVMKRDTGFFIKLYLNSLAGNFRKDYSKSLKEVIAYAFDNNFEMIELDSDAPVIQELNQHDW